MSGLHHITAVDPWLPPDGMVMHIPSQWILPDGFYDGIVINIAELRLYLFNRINNMAAFNYAGMAVDLIRKKAFGKMVALSGGRYTTVAISIVTGGAKRVDVSELYDADTYRPHIRKAQGKPMFLY